MWLGYVVTGFVLSPSDLLDEGLKNIIMTIKAVFQMTTPAVSGEMPILRHKKMPWSVEPCLSSHCPTDQLAGVHRPFSCSSCSPELLSCPHLALPP